MFGLNSKDILVIGDSWSVGWSSYLERFSGRKVHSQGIIGSTADEWAKNKNGCLSKAKSTKADTVIISLTGNDFQVAMKNDNMTSREIVAAYLSLRKVLKVLRRKKTIIILYADPFSGKDPMSRVAVPLFNAFIQISCIGFDVEFADTSQWLESIHFDGVDIHPNELGKKTIGKHLSNFI